MQHCHSQGLVAVLGLDRCRWAHIQEWITFWTKKYTPDDIVDLLDGMPDLVVRVGRLDAQLKD